MDTPSHATSQLVRATRLRLHVPVAALLISADSACSLAAALDSSETTHLSTLTTRWSMLLGHPAPGNCDIVAGTAQPAQPRSASLSPAHLPEVDVRAFNFHLASRETHLFLKLCHSCFNCITLIVLVPSITGRIS